MNIGSGEVTVKLSAQLLRYLQSEPDVSRSRRSIVRWQS